MLDADLWPDRFELVLKALWVPLVRGGVEFKRPAERGEVSSPTVRGTHASVRGKAIHAGVDAATLAVDATRRKTYGLVPVFSVAPTTHRTSHKFDSLVNHLTSGTFR